MIGLIGRIRFLETFIAQQLEIIEKNVEFINDAFVFSPIFDMVRLYPVRF